MFFYYKIYFYLIDGCNLSDVGKLTFLAQLLLPEINCKYSATALLSWLESIFADTSQTQQWIPLLPENTQSRFWKPKSSKIKHHKFKQEPKTNMMSA